MGVLVLAYRSLGGAQQRPVEPGALLTAAASAVAGALAGAGAAGQTRDTRRLVGTAQQCLDRLPDTSRLSTSQAGARDLLVAACEDLAWALRIGAATSHSTGVAAAVESLIDHARVCAGRAAELGEGALTASGEPLDRL